MNRLSTCIEMATRTQACTSQRGSAALAVEIPNFETMIERSRSDEVAARVPRTTPYRPLVPVERQQLRLGIDVPHLKIVKVTYFQLIQGLYRYLTLCTLVKL